MASKDLISAIAVCDKLLGRYMECSPDRLSRPISMNILTHVVQEYCGKKVNFKLVKWQSTYIKGSVKVWADRSDIVISSELNRCWTRYVACKELVHLAIDNLDGHTQNIVNLVRACCSRPMLSARWPVERDVQSETLAFIAAGELLFPFAERAVERDKVLRGEQKYFDIASYYRIPEAYVERLLSDEWMETLGEAHGQVDQIP